MVPSSQLPWGLMASMLAATFFGAQPACAGPSVDISMKAAFPSSPYLKELLETAAQEDPSSYFPLLDRIADGYFAQAKTDKELYGTFVDLLQKDGLIPSAESLSIFKLALSTRSAAPRVEAHYQYYQTGVEPSLKGDQQGCDTWVLLDGQQYCSASLEQSHGLVPLGQERDLPFDIAMGSGPSCILYADITAPGFGEFHKMLAQKARKQECVYKLRHRRLSHGSLEPLPVSGYGVELALKRTDYIVIDDRQAEKDAGEKIAVTSGDVLDEQEEVTDLKPLSTSELRDLGLRAGSFIMKSANHFDTLLKLTQDFPKYSTSLSTQNISRDFLMEHRANRASLVVSGMNLLWMNGVQLVERQMDPFTLVDVLRRERKMISGVMDLGLTGAEAISLLAHESVTEAKAGDAESTRFLWHDEPEDGKVIVWLNDIEKDKRYEGFPASLMALMQSGMPGQLPSVRRDISNLVMPVDLTQKNDTIAVVNQLQNFVKRKLPFRCGIVPLASNEASERQAKVVYHLVETYGLAGMMAYLSSILDADKFGDADQVLFEATIAERKTRDDAEPLTFDQVLTSEPLAEHTRLSRHWAERLSTETPTPVLLVNGVPLPRQGNWVPAMGNQIGADIDLVRRAVYFGDIREGQWIPNFFLKSAVSRRNAFIFPADPDDLTILDVNKMHLEHGDLFKKVPVVEANPDTTKGNWAVLTAIVDLTSAEGLKLAASALEFRSNSPGIRLEIINNPVDPAGAHKLNTALKMSQSDLPQVDNEERLQTVLNAWSGLPEDLDYDIVLGRFLAAARVRPGENKLILNGRIIGPIKSASQFGTEDFELLFEIEQNLRILPVYEAIEDLGMSSKISGPLAAAKLTSITALSTMSDLPEGMFEKASDQRTSAFNVFESNHTAFEIGDKSSATIQLVACLNPASEKAQRWVPILKVLSELDGVYMQIFLNPQDKLEDLPVKRFYRYVLDAAPQFDDAGKVKAATAEFKGLPSEALLNVGMDVPPAWLVASKESIHDLDNLKLSSIKSNVEATYELENILIEGHSREQSGALPRGVQLVLATEKDPKVADTIVMFNLGYFQFKANPGFYNIQLKEGRSSEIYHIESVGAKGYGAVLGDEGTDVVLMNFMGTTLYPRIHRKPGMEEGDVLDVGASEGVFDGVSKGLKNMFGVKSKSASDEEHAEINIFSVASGHLYERMLNIMMVSVMKNTKHTVKFWFIEQFLSPSFKDFIPAMAEEYGFKYEMVTYKWPHWLRQQKEKQREIWGYKILFLDVLFPLSLDKVIFVDADQIVRTDMYDLVQHDLQGKPYGFTPMCDSRTEMEGFRFWKQGYWANYLRGQPYHISALYVVDLRRFREIAAGDRLRQTYHTLSADPNSLSNLDQDLPNHMQFQLPIHSLPQEWLWCETWCSDEALTEARTIDLCNNPQTKEPKLDRARRQVPEWTVYDDEIAALDRRRKEKGSAGGGDDGKQKPVTRGDGEVLSEAGEGVQRNTKSRTLQEEEEPAQPTEHVKDEL